MSRVGKVPVKILQGVKATLQGNVLKVEGPKGKLSHSIPEGIQVKVDASEIKVTNAANSEIDSDDTKLLGVTRTLISNMVHGAHTGFTKELDINGVGFRAAVQGSKLVLTLGFSHPVEYDLPTGITAKVDKNTHISISGADKVLVGMTAAKVRGFRPPEPYQGKGIKYTEERILRKVGKAAGAK